jgi:hypothetical protein
MSDISDILETLNVLPRTVLMQTKNESKFHKSKYNPYTNINYLSLQGLAWSLCVYEFFCEGRITKRVRRGNQLSCTPLHVKLCL